MKKILILGAGGFIGTNLTNFFSGKPEYLVTGVLHKNFNLGHFIDYNSIYDPNFVARDLRNKEDIHFLFKNEKPDAVIHVAAVTTGSKDVIERPWLHVTDNTIMNSLVFEACHTYGVKHCIFLSCSVPYKSSEEPQKESDWRIEDIPAAYFGVGNMKVYSEKLCQFYAGLGKCKYTAIRHSNVFGPYDKTDLDKCHLMPAMIKKICESKGELEVWGDGTAKRDLLYVDNLVDFIVKVIEKQETPYELFNCGAGKAFSITHIIDLIRQVLGNKELKITYNNSKPNIPTTTILDCSKAKEQLGWQPTVGLLEGVSRTVGWYLENGRQ